MNDLIAVEKIAGWEKLKALVLDSVSSPITKRVYNMALEEFLAWFQLAPRPGFTKASVSAWRVSLEARGLGSSSIIIRMSAIRKLAAEAADNGLLAPELAAGIARVRSAKSVGIRMGNWLSVRQAQSLLNGPDISTVSELRDRVLLGCGLRRSEVAALTFMHVQQRDSRWCIVDLVGKHGRVRTVPMPTWVKVGIDTWTGPAGVSDGYVFRSVNRGDKMQGRSNLKRWCGKCCAPTRQPPECQGSCRTIAGGTAAKLCRAAGGELEQIQLLLGHASVQTTERYLGTKQDLVHAPNDAIKLRVSA
jgi:integrase/recombinase XerD